VCVDISVVLVVLVLVIVILVVLVLVVGGHNGLPVAVPIDIAEVAGAPVWAHFPPGELVPDEGLDVEGGIAAQVLGEEGPPPVYLPLAFWPITRDERHEHTSAVEVPPHREVDVRPRDGLPVGEELASQLDRHVDAVAQGPRSTRRPHRV
jgi:hypothetical protein